MKQQHTNVCYRCGRERVESKSWKEGEGINEITVTMNVCPDPECQKAVNKELKAQSDRAKLMAQRKEERLQARKMLRKTAMANSA